MGRKILGVIVGIIVGGLVAGAVETISHLQNPPPPNLDTSDMEAMRNWIGTLPPSAFVWVLVAHGLGALVAGLVCAAIVRKRWTLGSVVVGVVFVAFGAINLALIPHPVWFAVIDVLLYVPLAILGGKLLESKK